MHSPTPQKHHIALKPEETMLLPWVLIRSLALISCSDTLLLPWWAFFHIQAQGNYGG